MVRLLLLVTVLSFAPVSLAQNSTRKIRTAPSEMAARAGSAVQWRADLKTALAEAEELQKPVFWYVPTIRGSFMDRKPEVDRYMLAGPFSWPGLIELLNESCVPVRMAAGKAECERYDLVPIGFIEPGFLILTPSGEEAARQDRISVHHPAWYRRAIQDAVGAEAGPASRFPGRLDEGQASLFFDDLPRAELQPGLEERLAELEPALVPEALFLFGAGLYLVGEEARAIAAWQQVVDGHPEDPWAWKAAMEIERHGPFVHGFESYSKLAAGADQPSGVGTRAPVGLYDAAALWTSGTRFLIEQQRGDGSFQDSTYDFGGTDSLPNVYMAVTAIATTALLEQAARLADPSAEGAAVEAQRAELEAAIERAQVYLAEDSHLAHEDTDELIWAHMYRMRCWARWLDLRPQDEERIRPLLEAVSQALLDMQASGGGWAHEYVNPFVTSNCLIALKEVQRRGVELRGLDESVGRATAALIACRSDTGGYSYGMTRPGRQARAAIEGSVGRTPLGELALTMWAPDQSIGLEKAVTLSVEHEGNLLPVQKYDDHTRNFAYGGFFFWYDLHARVEAIVALPEGELRTRFAQQQREQILGLPEFDGTFVDSHEVGRAYGTAMALWCLATLDTAMGD